MNVKEKTKAGQRAKRGTQLALGGPHPPQPHPRRKAKFPLHTPTSTTHQGSLELQEGAPSGFLLGPWGSREAVGAVCSPAVPQWAERRGRLHDSPPPAPRLGSWLISQRQPAPPETI